MATRNLIIKLSGGEIVECKLHKVKPVGKRKPVVIERDENGEVIFRKRKTDAGILFDIGSVYSEPMLISCATTR